eukprot:symbB.v1.2.012482.t1/scaffold861.1/size176854/12
MGTSSDEVQKAQAALRQILANAYAAYAPDFAFWLVQFFFWWVARSHVGQMLNSSNQWAASREGMDYRPAPGLENFGPRAVGLVQREAKEIEMSPSDASTDVGSLSRYHQEEASPVVVSEDDSAQTFGVPCILQLQGRLEDSTRQAYPDDIPSIGSASHNAGLCKPCDFKCRSSCRFGYECLFCHICGPAESRASVSSKCSGFNRDTDPSSPCRFRHLESTHSACECYDVSGGANSPVQRLVLAHCWPCQETLVLIRIRSSTFPTFPPNLLDQLSSNVAVHVTEVLPERARMLAVDAKLPMQCVVHTILSEQHMQRTPGQMPVDSHSHGGGAGDMLRREGRERHLDDDESTRLCTGTVAAAFPTDVLAEVCEIDAVSLLPEGPPQGQDDEKTTTVRRWTSPDDGWGTHLIPSDLEKMPMGMPVTVGELADFLSHACTPQASDHIFDWSLEQWRAHRMKASQVPDSDGQEKTSHLDLVEGPSGPLLVHRVPSAPPRPILCADDPEATLLKAIQLLLAYPKCNALPVVSPIRLTVMAYLTLSACLAFILNRLRGEQLLPLAQLKVGGEVQVGTGSEQKKFEYASYVEPSVAEAEGSNSSWVLSETQPLRELLHFFAKTHHTTIPVVEDAKGSLVYNLSRRDLLSYLDLAMQSARLDGELGRLSQPASPDDSDRCPSETPNERIIFDPSAPLDVVVKALKRYKVDDSRLRAVEVATNMLQEQSLLDGLMAEAPRDPKGQASV